MIVEVFHSIFLSRPQEDFFQSWYTMVSCRKLTVRFESVYFARNNGVVFEGPQESPLATVKRRKLAWFGHATRRDSFSKPSFEASWKVGDAVVGRRNAGWPTPKSRHSCPCQNCPRWSPAEKTGTGSLLNRRTGSLLNRRSCLPDDPIGQETQLLFGFTNKVSFRHQRVSQYFPPPKKN